MSVKSLAVSLAAMFVSLSRTSMAYAPAQPLAAQYPEPRSRTPVRTQRPRLRNGRELSSFGKLEQCQVGRETERPCPNPAAVEIRGVPFCECCAREQEAYFTVGEITQKLADDRTRQVRNSLDESLAEALDLMRWGFDERLVEAEEYAEAVK
ncbi:MAG: hypothetical protein H0X71_11700 [Rubrobacter sp.]|nr:hypothetical protein [Rubrobacter sp.]